MASDFVKFDYRDLVAIRDLMKEVDGSEQPLNSAERLALAKTERILDIMREKREVEDQERRLAPAPPPDVRKGSPQLVEG